MAKKFTAQEKASAKGALKIARDSMESAEKAADRIVPDSSSTYEVTIPVVDGLHLAKANIEFALADLGGKPCGGGRPC